MSNSNPSFLDNILGGSVTLENDGTPVQPAVTTLSITGGVVTYDDTEKKHKLNITGTGSVPTSRVINAASPVLVNGGSATNLVNDVTLALTTGGVNTVLGSNGTADAWLTDPVVTSITGTSSIKAGPVGASASLTANGITFASGNATLTSPGALEVSVSGAPQVNFSGSGLVSFDSTLTAPKISQSTINTGVSGHPFTIRAQDASGAPFLSGGDLHLSGGAGTVVPGGVILELAGDPKFAVTYIGINAYSQQIHNLADPTSAQDAASKAYVDLMASGIKVHTAVKAVAVSSTGGAYSGPITVDGVSLTESNRLLTTAESISSNNCLWTVRAGAWTRVADLYDGSHASGAFVFVTNGTNYANSGWICNTSAPNDVVGTNSLSWAQMSAAGQILPGACLTKTGSTLDVVAATRLVPGSMSPADKTKLDDLTISGDTNYLPKFIFSTSIGNSSITDNGSLVTVNSAFAVVGSSGNTGIALQDTGAGSYASWSIVSGSPNSTSGIFYLVNASNPSHVIYCVKHTGEVGINTITPATTLDINGTLTVRGGSPGVGKLLRSDANGTCSWKSLADLNLVQIGGDIGGTSSSPAVVSLSGLYGEILTSAGTIRKTSGYLALQADNGAVDLISNYGISLTVEGSAIATFAYSNSSSFDQGIFFNYNVSVTGGFGFSTHGGNSFYCGSSGSPVCTITSNGFWGPGSVHGVTVTNTPSGAGKVLTSTSATSAAWL